MIRVLAIEDNAKDRKVLAKALKSSKIASMIYVNFITQVTEAVNIKSYDVIITDLKLGETNGAETITAIRAVTDAPIIIISGSYLSDENEKAMLIAATNKSSCRYIRKGDSWTTKIGDYIRDVLRDSFYNKQGIHCINMITNYDR